ncbi:substrate-binding domain-containing protein [Thermoleptolyngbya sp. C42_A2020_037]|uniref:substrate-binding domain-containing protein n=1 Tax=Thermoleptolyngbya sp. C42_A2020_037 TaxID=2747799 RepID=UPI0019DE97F1|nr:substrate-binding domain-containing protein [Thermoleptolyngbya sp. C42_A2020_037]MBF2084357.1 helix-turn-helix domain-containing protein [Thermoleptolyngbya sp. C42_A2020_037]
MKPEHDLCNNLKQVRLRLGMSQQDLAAIAGVSRQTIGGVEAGQYAPSTTVALRLSRALGCQVEDLFWLEQDAVELDALPTQNFPTDQATRLSLARVGGQWIAHPLKGNAAFRTEMVPADGEGRYDSTTQMLRVHLLDDLEKLHRTVVIAGCTPALSLWARAAERWHPDLRVHWTLDNSMCALDRLCCGEVHLAGMHLYDAATRDHNVPFVKTALQTQAVLQSVAAVVINLGSWEEGLLIQPGNPLQLKTIEDLTRPDVKIVNREAGAGSRQVLERSLQVAGIPSQAVRGFDTLAAGHLEVARAIATGQASAGVSTASVAAAFGLEFIPLHRSRYDLVTLQPYLEEAPVQQLLSTLGHRRVLSQLQRLGGYDTSQTGDILSTVMSS